jgi:antagonist of KipI
MTIRVLKPGLLTTVQGRGRYGYSHLGISPCGAADALSLRIANLLVGNAEYAPALEMTLLGATMEFERSTIVALSGASCDCKIGQYRVPQNTAVEVPAGGVLHCGIMVGGARCYLAAQGWFDVSPVMGSASTDVRGGFGGVAGRRLQAGDILQIGRTRDQRPRRLRAESWDGLWRSGPIRVTRGAQNDWFGPEAWETFLTTPYVVTEQADRAGLRLKGRAIYSREQKQLLTDGIPLGAIQIPQDGEPIILFVDQQTTGGYPKIANVISADMHRVGQLLPRDEVRFAEVSLAEAVNQLRLQQDWFEAIWIK